MYYRSVFAAFSADRPDLKKVYDTANFHHFVHTLALLAVPLCRRPALVSPRIQCPLGLATLGLATILGLETRGFWTTNI